MDTYTKQKVERQKQNRNPAHPTNEERSVAVKASAVETQIARCASWAEHFDPSQWALYKAVIQEAQRRGAPFAVGGGLAAMTYAGQWRDTKDLDLYILRRDRDELIGATKDLGLHDYYEKQPYDREWIYRSYNGDCIIDLMWAMANQRAQVDESWFQGAQVETDGVRFRLLAPEEALWSKLYVLQRDRSDWPDILNLLYGVGPEINYRRVLCNLGSDAPLLAGVLVLFAWLCPARALQFPDWLWKELDLERPARAEDDQLTRDRARLLDTRPWFTPTLDSQQTP